MQHKLFSLYERLILRHPRWSLLLTLLLTAWLATYIPQVTLDASADSLVLEGDESLKYYREISKRFQTEDFLVVTYQPKKDLFTQLDVLAKLRDALAALPGVASVVTILDVPLLNSPPLTLDEIGDDIPTLTSPGIDIALARTELTTSPLYKDLLINEAGTTTALQVNLTRDQEYYQLLERREQLREQIEAGVPADQLAEKKQQLTIAEQQFDDYAANFNDRRDALVAMARAVIDPYRAHGELFLGGVPMITADMISFVKSDLRIFGVGIISFIIITLAIIFRQFIWIVLPLITCLLSVTFMLGLTTWFGWHMTVISSNVIALLLIITLSITIHLVVRYRELVPMLTTLNQHQLVTATTRLMAKPCLYTVLTTIVAFASLVISGIRPVIDFGWMMTMGVTIALLMTFIILPTCLLLFKQPIATPTAAIHKPMTLYFATLTAKYGRTILWTSGALAIISLYGISRLEVENRFIDYFDSSTEIYQGMEVIDAQLGGTIPLEIIIDKTDEDESYISPTIGAEQNASLDDQQSADWQDDGWQDTDDFADENGSEPSYWFTRAGLTRIEQVHDYLDALPETGKVMSLATGYKVLKQLQPDVDDIQLALIQTELPAEVSEALIQPYLDEAIDETRIVVRVMETSETLRRAELLQQVHDHLIDDLGFAPEQIHLTGMLVLYNNMLQSLYRSQILTLGAVFVAIVIMLVVLFRSLRLALLAIIPTILAAAMVLGAMGIIGISLDIMTVTIAAISVGIGIDHTIHYVYRFRRELRKDGDYLATMYRCHGSIGKAMFYTSMTIIVGFSILALSNFKPSIYFGLLTGSAMLISLLGALLLLPQLLIVFRLLKVDQSQWEE